MTRIAQHAAKHHAAATAILREVWPTAAVVRVDMQWAEVGQGCPEIIEIRDAAGETLWLAEQPHPAVEQAETALCPSAWRTSAPDPTGADLREAGWTHDSQYAYTLTLP